MVKLQWICIAIANHICLNKVQREALAKDKKYINKEEIKSGWIN